MTPKYPSKWAAAPTRISWGLTHAAISQEERKKKGVGGKREQGEESWVSCLAETGHENPNTSHVTLITLP